MYRFFKTAAVLALVIFMAGGCSAGGSWMRSFVPADRMEADSRSPAEDTGGIAGEETHPGEVYVYVCGCVKHPDVYCLPAGARGIDAVNAAGGFTKEANRSAWNLATVLEDGTQITIPSRQEEGERAGKPEDTQGEGDRLVDINQASEEELVSLPGIGETRAREIVAYRSEHGLFSSIEEITNVSGIGEGIYTKIKDYITVS